MATIPKVSGIYVSFIDNIQWILIDEMITTIHSNIITVLRWD